MKNAHKTKSQRRIIIPREWGKLYGVTGQTINKYIKRFNEHSGEEYDPRDIFSVLKLHNYLSEVLTI